MNKFNLSIHLGAFLTISQLFFRVLIDQMSEILSQLECKPNTPNMCPFFNRGQIWCDE